MTIPFHCGELVRHIANIHQRWVLSINPSLDLGRLNHPEASEPHPPGVFRHDRARAARRARGEGSLGDAAPRPIGSRWKSLMSPEADEGRFRTSLETIPEVVAGVIKRFPATIAELGRLVA